MIKNILTPDDFKDIMEVQNKLIILKFGSTWCGPCRKIQPYLENLSEEYKDCIFCSIDIDNIDTELILKKFNIESVPQFFLIKDTEIVYEQSGIDKMVLTYNINKFKKSI